MVVNEKSAVADVIARAWSDPDFKLRLKSEPRVALCEMGLQVPDDVEVTVLEDTPEHVHFTLPPPPFASTIGLDDIERAGGRQLGSTPNDGCSTHPCCPYSKKK